MPPLDPRFVLPALELAAAWWLFRRIEYRRYPMLFVYLIAEAISQTILIWIGSHSPLSGRIASYLSPVRLLIRAGVVFEIYAFACITIGKRKRIALLAWSSAFALALMALTAPAVPKFSFSPYFLFYQFMQLFLAAAAVALTVYVIRNPIMENQDHRAYRLFMTLIMVRAAVGGAFVLHGLGYYLVKDWRKFYTQLDNALWIAAIIIVPLMAHSMTSNISCLRPEVAFRVKEKQKAKLRAKAELQSK